MPFHSFKHEDHVYGEPDFVIIVIIVPETRHGLKRNFKRIRMWGFLLWNDLDINWWFALTTDHTFFYCGPWSCCCGPDFTPKVLTIVFTVVVKFVILGDYSYLYILKSSFGAVLTWNEFQTCFCCNWSSCLIFSKVSDLYWNVFEVIFYLFFFEPKSSKVTFIQLLLLCF